ncbi:RagB/SusD family nutrient uptake outer membrane protein [Chitinophaga sp. 212800010-3]|uniref:RagB/SusD family nutrient uptake outer membrane protein n=1 Tax=unclassified Chitinophaga TaxID=2619133 RepID=UPI002DED3887|nr:RagB/SusD family nutrient uptake outer membrane protein [Chitinophaga sp. 212800010-3]
MIHTFIKRILLFLVIIGVASCNKMLDVKPTDQVDGDAIFQSLNTVNKAVLGVYADWRPEASLRMGSVMADECRIGLKNAGVGSSAQNLFRWQFSGGDTEISDVWNNAYQVINRANRILKGIDKVPASTDADKAAKQQLQGELLAIRAFAHFELYRNFGYSGIYKADALAVPYVTDIDINSKPSRPATDAFFSALTKDLTAAIGLLSGSDDVTRMGLQAAYALQARVALYTGNWVLAAESASKAIGKQQLATPDVFPSIWTDQSNAEVIFKLKRTNQSSTRPGDIWFNASSSVVLFAPSGKLMQAYDTANDVRYNSYIGKNPALAADGQLTDIITKYQGNSGAVNLNDIKVFRVGEMYLIRAEAYQHLGRYNDAAADLNTLCAARISRYEAGTWTNGDQLLKAILAERFRELPFEGHRYYDLKRLGLTIERNTGDLQHGDTQTTLAPADQYYYLPIPQSEILSNPNIKPNNKGW